MIDWTALAHRLGLVTETAHGFTERGGGQEARDALSAILGPEEVRAAVDHHVQCGPGSELARRVLWLLRPAEAMRRCQEIYLSDADIEDRRMAVALMRNVGSPEALDWVPLYLSDPDPMIQTWGAGVIDQLLQDRVVEPQDCEAVLRQAEAHPNPRVQARARWVREHMMGGET